MNQENQNNYFQNSRGGQNNITNVQPIPNVQNSTQGQQPIQSSLNFQMPETKVNESQPQQMQNVQSLMQGHQTTENIANSTNQPMQPNLNFQMPESKTNESIQQTTENITNSTNQPMQPNLNFQMPANGINGNTQQSAPNITNSTNQQPINNLTQPLPKQKTNKNVIIIASILIVVAVIATVFFLNRTTTLVCTDSETSVGMDMTMEATMKFRKNEILSITAVMTVDLGKYANQKELFIETLEDSYSSSEYDDIDVKITSDDNKVYVTMKADKNNFKHTGLITSKTLDEARKELEEDGFVCK